MFLVLFNGLLSMGPLKRELKSSRTSLTSLASNNLLSKIHINDESRDDDNNSKPLLTSLTSAPHPTAYRASCLVSSPYLSHCLPQFNHNA
jgi:hypothetical protein